MIALTGVSLVCPAVASAAALAGGDLAVYRVGDGSTALGTAAQAVFVDEYTPAGTLVQSIAMPTTASGTQLQLTAGGSANSEGFLSVSADAKTIALTGYATAVGSSSPGSGAAGTPVRSIGLLSVSTGLVDTSTGLNDVSSIARSAYSPDSTNVFYAGGSGGFRGTTAGTNGASTAVSTTVTNNRVVRAFAGQLYGSTGSGTSRVGTIGTGISNTPGQTFTGLAGITSTNVVSGYGFFLADLSTAVAGLDTLYVCDDAATTGGIQKYSLVGGTWTSNGKVGSVSTYRGLDAVVTAGGVQLYAAGSGAIYSLLDTTGYNGTIIATPATIVTAPTNTAFRGIAFVPEPTTTAALAAGVLAVARRRRPAR